MPGHRPPAHDIDSYDQFVEFFDQAVMAAYAEQSDRFTIETDYFDGRLSSRDRASAADPIDIRFGYRTLENGDLAIAVFRPDLYRKSPAHVQRWSGFRLRAPKWAIPDERYTLWLRRCFDGDWNVENGSRGRLEGLLGTINALTTEMVGAALFASDSLETLTFPLAQNTHRYEDAHRTLYGYLIDGLEKDCIARLGAKAGVTLKLSSDRTVAALKKLPSRPADTSPLWEAFDRTSQQRGLASHKVRPLAKRFAAFEQLSLDLDQWVTGLQDLLSCLEKTLGMRGSMAVKRQTAKRGLPKITKPPEPHYSIGQLPQIIGKTVERVEYGFREDHQGLHQSEAMILHFTDGSSLGIDTGSNVGNLTDQHDGLTSEEFHVDFILQWVPSPDSDEAVS